MERVKGKGQALLGKVKDAVTDVTSHWKKPAKNKFVPYKEVLNYSIGGMGIQCMIYVMGFLGLGAGNTLIGSTIGIRPMHLQYMAAIQGILGIAFPIIRGKFVDNTRTKYGRFRPYLALAGLPLLLLCSLYIWLPFETMSYMNKLIATFCFTIAISFVTPLFTDTYGELGSCLTPNTAERTNIFAVSSIIYSFAPTLYYTFVPILSNLTGGLTDIRTYKFIIIPVGIIGVALSLFTAFGCKERVVTSKNYVQKVGILEGMKAVFSNKYWWIRNSATILGFMEMASGVIFGWIYIYSTQDMVTFGILNTVWGTASGLSMLCTPLILKKLGNRRTLLLHNSINIVFTTLMMFSFKLPGVYFVFMYLNTFVNQLQIVYNPVLAAEVKDSIQYESGKRLDFTLGAAWTVVAPIMIATGFVLPYVYEIMGLTVNYDILYDPLIRNGLFGVLCLCSIVGAALNLIPFFFYNLSREKHQMIILALRYRAINQDYSLGTVNCYQIREVVEMYNEAMAVRDADSVDVKAKRSEYFATLKQRAITEEIKTSEAYNNADTRKQTIKDAKASLKARRKEAWRAYVAADKLMEQKSAYEEIFARELDKYNKEINKVKYEVSCRIRQYSIEDIKTASLDISDITWDSSDERQNRKIAKYLKRVSCDFAKMQARVIKKYADTTLVNDYWARLEAAIDEPCTTKEEMKAHDIKVKALEKELKTFQKEFKCYNDAVDFANGKDNSDNFDRHILPMYEDAKLEAEELDRLAEEKEAKEKAEHKAEIERIRAERKAKKLAKKGIDTKEDKEEEK